MTDKPLVSAVIPAYNAAWCVGRALESVLAQTYAPIEILVVDDGSSDDLDAALAPFGDKVRKIPQPHAGLSAARNRGMRAAAGEFVAFLDADDQWLPEKTARQVELLQAHPEVGFCSTAARVIDPEGNPVNMWDCEAVEGGGGALLKKLFHYNTVAGSGSGVMVRAPLLAGKGFDEKLGCVEDVDMWMQLAVAADYACIPEPLTLIERRGDSMSRDVTAMREAHLYMVKKNRTLLPPEDRGGFWRRIYALTLTGYVKLEARRGNKGLALRMILEGFLHAPLAHGRLLTSLFLAVIFNREV